jgi:tetratricopeptide (TPR) repeat protein
MKLILPLSIFFCIFFHTIAAQNADSAAQQLQFKKFENYIVQGEEFLKVKEYKKAKTQYQQALLIYPEALYPKDKIEQINKIYNDPDDELAYNAAIKTGDDYFSSNKFEKAKTEYEKALSIKPKESYPKEKIKESRAHIFNMEELRKNFDEAVASGDRFFKEGEIEKANAQYTIANNLFPGEKYPIAQLEKTGNILAEVKATNEAYDKAIDDADNYYIAKEFEKARNEYLKANIIKPDERYPLSMIEQIKAKQLEEKKQLKEIIPIETKAQVKTPITKEQTLPPASNMVKDIVAMAKELPKELKETKKKPTEETNTEINAPEKPVQKPEKEQPSAEVLAEPKVAPQNQAEPSGKKLSDVYYKHITDGDHFMATKAFDQAIEMYRAALKSEPSSTLPNEKIAEAITLLSQKKLITFNSSALSIVNNTEKKFTFTPANLKQKGKNFIVLRAKINGDKMPRIFLNYGKDKTKNGGIVMKGITEKNFTDYVIKISAQDPWWRLDNNWISLYSAGGDIEIEMFLISNGE